MKPGDMIHQELSLTNPDYRLVANLLATRLDFQERHIAELEKKAEGGGRKAEEIPADIRMPVPPENMTIRNDQTTPRKKKK